MTIAGDIQNLQEQLSLIEGRLTEVRGVMGGEIPHENVELDYLDTPTYDNLHQFINNTCSAMRISGGAVTASGANEIDVALGTGILKITDSEIGANTQFDWAAEANIVIAADETTWVGIEYNGGSPKVKIDTDLSNFNFNTDFILARAYNHGGVVCVLNAGSYYSNFQHKVCYRLFDVEVFTRAAGAVIGDKGNLDFDITEGRFYCGTTPFTFTAWDCSGADRFTYWYRDGGGDWTTLAAQADIDDAHYDDGNPPLGNLSANRYGVHWVYICHDDEVHVQYGQGDYKLNEAEAAQVPTGPDFFAENAKLVGKIIVKVGAGVLTDVLSAFEEVFIGAAASIHNELGGLQGGQADQYYHLNAAEHPYVSGANAQSLLTTASPTFNDLTISVPVNIYALSHDSFADFDGDKHVAHSGVDITAGTGLTGGGNIAATKTINVDVGIALNKIPPITVADVGDDDYARFTATGLEGRHPTELLADCSAQCGAAFDWNTQAIQNIGDIQAAGHIGLADAAVDPDIGISFHDTITDTDNTAKEGIRSHMYVAKTVGAATSSGIGIYGSAILDSTNTQNWTNASAALRGIYSVIITQAGSSGIVSHATNIFTYAVIADAATVTNLYGLLIFPASVGGGKLTNQYGIKIGDQNAGAVLNYALYTGAGLVRFGDKVGIGLETPLTPLHVFLAPAAAHQDIIRIGAGYGGISEDYFRSFDWHDGNDAVAAIGVAYDGAKVNMHFHSFYNSAYKSEANVLMTILADGKVGIGTAVPAYPLHIKRPTAGTAFAVEDDTGYALSMSVDNLGTGTFYLKNATVNSIILDGDGHCTFVTGGNVGIGTAAPGELVELFGATPNLEISNTAETCSGIFFTDSGAPTAQYAKILFDSGDTIGSTANTLSFYVMHGTARMLIDNTGKVGIGTVAPTSMLQVVGIPAYANNAAAVAGGLTAGAFYRTNADPASVCVVI